MFKPIKDALEIDPRLIDEPKIIGEELKKELARIESELHQLSDYCAAYGELSASCGHIVKALETYVSRYEEAD